MPLSRELQKLHEDELTYQGDPELVGSHIRNLELHGIVGPTTVGKTTIISRVVDLMPDTNAVPSATDRERKDGDPKDYETASEGITTKQLIHDKVAGALVNYAVFKTGIIYATYPDYYSATHNFLPTMSSSIPQLGRAGFKKFDLTYLYMRAHKWEALVKKKDFGNKKRERMLEAIESLEYGIEHADSLTFLRNRMKKGDTQTESGRDKTARELMLIVTGNSTGDDPSEAIEELKAMRDIAYDLAQ